MFQQIEGQSGNLCWRWVLASSPDGSSRGELKNALSNQCGCLCWWLGPKKLKLCRGCWVLASCQIVQPLQKEKSKLNNHPIRGYVYLSTNRPENDKLGKGRWKFCKNMLSGCKGGVEIVSANQRQSGHLCWRIDPKCINWIEDVEYLLSVEFR